MCITDILAAKDIEAALASVAADNSFQYKAFFHKVGLCGKTADQIKRVFEIFDRDCSGYIEEDELALFLKNFKSDARALNDAETKAFLKAGDSDGDGKIGIDEFQALVKA
ncbi:parvalbumin beta-like [Bufo gargarizans]|uniref:parvalbumin beta-like n=1 Tax=Bufo gargarizans TaxID=30331 RepID=UPI001CF559DA|nr:parvalbumin beta-like [Bufo gargarizans]